MAQTIKLKRSSVQNNVPSTSDLELGELAINTYDGKLFIKKDDGSASIVQVGGIVGTSELTDGSVTTSKLANDAVNADKLADNSVGIAALNVSDGTNGQVLTTNGSGTLSFATVSGGSGQANQNAFSNVNVSGQNSIVADSTTDTLTFAAGSGIQLTTNNSTDTLTITSTATGSVTEAFKTIAVSGQSNVVADGATDTLTLAAGSNMTITTNASNDTITFASSGGGSGNTGGIDSQVFNGDGSTTAFTLTTSATTEDNLWVFVDGVYQNKDSYSVSGTTLTMGTAPDNGTKLAVHHVRVGTPANGTITAAMLASPLSLSGDFAVDTNVLKVDATNNRVGVNITTPSHPLDVVGNTNITGEAYVSSQIGIGTTSPAEPLHIVASDPKIKLQDSDGTSTFATIFQASDTLVLQSRNNTANGSIRFQGHNGSAGTQYGIFNASGKFGLGTNSPSYSLHINHTDAMLVPVGTTAQRPTAAEGLFRYNSDDDKFEGYTASGWGAIAGSGGGSSSTFLKQEFTGNGSTTAFTLQVTVTSEDNLIVFNEGVFQRQDSYAASGTTITFDTAPANGNKVVVYQMETGVVGVAPVVDTMTGDGSDTTLTLSTTPASENQTFLTIDGVMQHKSTYSISGTTLTFSAAPPNGSNVECITLVNSSVKVIADTDGDTQIQLEESTDEDKIRFDTGGFERVVIDSTGLDMEGRLDVGEDLRIRGSAGSANQGVVRFSTNSSNLLSIDPANDGSNAFLFSSSGDLTVPGNLTVSGDTITANVATLDVEDKNITLNKGSGDTSGSANGAGITIQDAVNSSTDATILWDASNDEFDFSHAVNIAGNLTLSGTVHSTKYDIHNEGGGSLFQTDGYLRFANGNTETVRIDSSGQLGIGTTSPSYALDVVGKIKSSDRVLSNVYQSTSTYGMAWKNSGGTDNMFLSNAGSLGIGTTSPSYKFDVYGTDDVTMRIHRPSSGLAATDTCGIGFSQRGDANTSTTDTRAGIFSTYNGDLFLAVEAGGNLNSNPMDHSALFIEGTNANVGLGTTSPTSALHVTSTAANTNGMVRFQNNMDNNYETLRIESLGNYDAHIGFFADGDANHYWGAGVDYTDGNFKIANDNLLATNTKFVVQSNGYLVAQSASNIRLVLGSTGNPDNNTSNWIRGNSGYLQYNSANLGHTWEITGTERMRISSSGNLGIGETSPSARLHVNHGTDHVIFTGPTGNGGGVLILRSSNASTADNQEYGMVNYQNNTGQALAQIVGKSEGSGNDKGHLEFNTKSGSGSMSNRMRIRDNGTVQVTGALSKGSGSFEIPHPLESKKDTHLLRHSFIEGPQCDNIYRGTVELVDGTATVNLDTVSNMTSGTFVALNTDVQVFTTNETDWDNVKGSIVGNVLTITCQNNNSTAKVSWLVIGERQDDNIKSSTLTDNDGKLILEPEAYEGGT